MSGVDKPPAPDEIESQRLDEFAFPAAVELLDAPWLICWPFVFVTCWFAACCCGVTMKDAGDMGEMRGAVLVKVESADVADAMFDCPY